MNFYETKTTTNFTVESLGEVESDVYDIEVEDTHNFYGNEILVHNSVWGNQDAANILKAALDSYEERTVSWFSPLTFNVSTLSDEEKERYNEEIDANIGNPDARIKYPSEFIYNGRIIFISNLPESKMDSAVLSRSAKIDMTLTEEEKLLRLESIVDKVGNKSVPLEKKKEIIDFLKTEIKGGGLKSGISMRTYIAAENLYLSGIPDWRMMLAHM